MPDLEVDIVVFDETLVGTEIDSAPVGLDIDLGGFTSTGTITDVEVAEVQLPESIGFENTVKNEGGVPGLLKLGAVDPVPPGTPAGTVILRTS